MSVWDKLSELKDTLQGENEHPVPAGGSKGQDEIREEIYGETRKEEEIQSKEGWSDKIRDVLDGGEARRKREEEEERLRIEREKEEAKRKVESERGWTGRIHDALDGGKHRQELEDAEFKNIDQEAQLERKRHDRLSDKIKDALGGADEMEHKVMEIAHGQRDQTNEKGNTDREHSSNKVKELWQHAPTEEKKEQEEHHKVWERKTDGERSSDTSKRGDAGWRDQVRALAGGSHQEEKKQVERGWLKEKLNEMAGGGVKSEVNEDKLDKTIDLVQEHILKQGDQSSESALEQMKDEQISDAIRMAYAQVTGHELPVKDK